MIRVQVRPNEPLEGALRRFKRQCNYAGIFRLAKKSAVYEKPSEKRRRERRERVRNIQRSIRKMMQAKTGRKSKSKKRPPLRRNGSVSPASAGEAPQAKVAVRTPAVPAEAEAAAVGREDLMSEPSA